MNFVDILFYIFAVILVCSGLKVVTAKNPMHAVLFLVLAFSTSACLWMLMQAEFLAIILVLVYVGAVMVFFLFVVMMLNINIEQIRQGFWKNLPVALVVGAVIAIEIILILLSPKIQMVLDVSSVASASADTNNARDLGRILYTDYIFPVVLASVLLTLGMVAAITLVHRESRQKRYVNPADQVKVTANSNRVRVVKMAAEIEEIEQEAENIPQDAQEQENKQ